MTVTLLAPAKLNLALHVTGRRADGYHVLDSLVAFAAIGDSLCAASADDLSLAVDGPFAAALAASEDNLVLRAARLLAATVAERTGRRPPGARLDLFKRLPVAAGIGGGSADAAATLRALDRLWGAGLGTPALARLGAGLGADVPMCVHCRPARVGGIGDIVEPAPALPALDLLLVNPGVAVATPDVFHSLRQRDNPPLPALPAAWEDLDHLAGWLETTRNDLGAAAEAIAPAIREVLAALDDEPACRFARMSGSGPTCFGLCPPGAAPAAALRLRARHPGWWIEVG